MSSSSSRLGVFVGALARERLLHLRLPRQLLRAGRLRRYVAKPREVGHERVEQVHGVGGARRCRNQLLPLLEQPIDERVVARAPARLHGLQLHPFDGLEGDVVRRQRVPAVEDCQMVRRGQLPIEQAHLDVVEVFGARGAEDGKGHGGARLAVWISGAGRDDAGDVVLSERHLHRDAGAARHAGQVDPLRVNREAPAEVGRHRPHGRHRDGPRAVPRGVRSGDDVAVLFGRRLVFLDHEPSSRSGVKRDQQVPGPVGRIGRRHIQSVALRRIGRAFHVLDNGPAWHVLRAGAGGVNRTSRTAAARTREPCDTPES